jgi:hypothetical protein
MKNHLKTRDYELISAYLDNHLGRKERAIFEARLKSDTLRAPRNYFVKAEVTQARPTFRLAPVFGIVSAIASVLLALVIFGNTFLSSSPQSAMAPIAPQANTPLTAQQEIERSVTSPVSTTEAAPSVMLGAPILTTPAPTTGALEVGQTEIATPTTIYLYAYPPTSTPESGITINDQTTDAARLACEAYYGGGAYPTPSNLYNCPTVTSTPRSSLGSIPPSSTPSQSETPSITPTSSPNPTSTLTPMDTPTSTSTPTPYSVEKSIPSNIGGSSTEITPPEQLLGSGNPVPADQEPTEVAAPNVSFINYIVLTVEISLAAIAIIAGIVAIILRFRAR